MLVYDEDDPADEYGGLSVVPLDLSEFDAFAVDVDTFECEAGALSRRIV